jgi:hypothetical protein
VSLPRPYDRSHPRLRRDTPAFDERDVRKDLADHVAPYTDITPPVPAPEEPWYDARYEPPAEGHGRPRESHYPITDHPDYTARKDPVDDYGPRPSVLGERAPRPPRPAPPERLPTYEDTVRAGRLMGPLWPRPTSPEHVPTVEDLARAAEMAGPLGLRPAPAEDNPEFPAELPVGPLSEEALPIDVAWDQMAEQAFSDPTAAGPPEEPPALDSLLGAELAPPPEPDDPIALANQAFDQQMHDAFHALPDPFAEPPGGLGGLEEAIMMEPPPDLCDPFGPGGMPFM